MLKITTGQDGLEVAQIEDIYSTLNFFSQETKLPFSPSVIKIIKLKILRCTGQV
jgi:hypothetical protein